MLAFLLVREIKPKTRTGPKANWGVALRNLAISQAFRNRQPAESATDAIGRIADDFGVEDDTVAKVVYSRKYRKSSSA